MFMDCKETFKLILNLCLVYGLVENISAMDSFETGDVIASDGGGIAPITDKDWLENIVPSGYDETISPGRFMNNTTLGIIMNILPISISDISEKHMNFEVELYIRVYWKEPRLPYDTIKNRTSLVTINPPRQFLDNLWNPYLRFTNCKFCEKERRIAHAGIEHLDVWLKILEETVSVSYRQTLRFSCHFDLYKYPLDSHVCNIFIDSIVLPREKSFIYLKYRPLKNYSESHYVEKYIPSQYKLIDVKIVNECSDLNPFAIDKPNNECVKISFHFSRRIYNDLVLLYLPSTFIVIVSWLSFWMDVEASAPRVALGLTSLLTLSTQFANAQRNLPPVSYVKAIDVWMLFCEFMVFISLVEYLISFHYKKWKKLTRIENDANSVFVYQVLKNNPRDPKRVRQNQKGKEKLTSNVDFVARIIFPVSFLIFNLTYWIYFG